MGYYNEQLLFTIEMLLKRQAVAMTDLNNPIRVEIFQWIMINVYNPPIMMDI